MSDIHIHLVRLQFHEEILPTKEYLFIKIFVVSATDYLKSDKNNLLPAMHTSEYAIDLQKNKIKHHCFEDMSPKFCNPLKCGFRGYIVCHFCEKKIMDRITLKALYGFFKLNGMAGINSFVTDNFTVLDKSDLEDSITFVLD